MTVSSTLWCRRLSALAALAALLLGVAAALPARADGIDVKRAALMAADDGHYLEADFEITLTHTLEDALSKGVPLYFTLEFELIRPRWYWFNEKISNARQQYRLSYNALTRQYRVGVRTFYENFATLAEALEFMSRVRLSEVIAPGALGKGTNFTASLRMRLDTSQLPRPFQISAVGSREWSVGSDWYRWTISP